MSAPSDAPRRPLPGRPTRVAVVGAGFIADVHLEILAGLEGVEVLAVVDPALDRARALAARRGVPEALASLEDLASREIDVAHVLVPPDLHGAVVRQLFGLGIGVLVEKPFVLSGNEARELAALAAARGLPLGVNHNHAFQPAFTRLVERVEAGEIGTVEHVQVTWSVPLMQLDAEQYAHWMFKSPRNIVYEQGPHPLSQVHRLAGRLGDLTSRPLGERELLPGQRFVDRWLAAGRGERATVEVYLAFGQGLTRNTLTVLGSDGYLEADYTHDTLSGERKTPWLEFWNSFLAAWRRGGALRCEGLRGLRGYLAATLGLAPRSDAFFVGMRESITSFHRALRAGAPLPVDAAAAAEVLDWCDAVAAAVPDEEAPRVELSETPARPGEVVVLGGTGFIGKRVVAELLEAGRPVTCVVRRTHSLPVGLARAAGEGRVRLVRGSLEDTAGLAALLAGAEAVVHLATGGGDTWEEVERSMVRGSVRVGEACLEAGVRRLVYVSSIAAVDTAHPGTLRDSPATDPRAAERGAYARGKAATEEALQALHRERGLPLVVVRPGVVVGEGTPMQHSGYGLWVRDNHCVGWGEGNHPLPLVLVDDVAWAVARAALHPSAELDGRALNLCTRVPIDARTAVAELRAATGRDLHFHPRPLERSQAMEVGKWLVKRVGGRSVEFPSYHDLRTRGLFTSFTADLARDVLGWAPCEEREAFLDRAVRIHGRGEQGR